MSAGMTATLTGTFTTLVGAVLRHADTRDVAAVTITRRTTRGLAHAPWDVTHVRNRDGVYVPVEDDAGLHRLVTMSGLTYLNYSNRWSPDDIARTHLARPVTEHVFDILVDAVHRLAGIGDQPGMNSLLSDHEDTHGGVHAYGWAFAA